MKHLFSEADLMRARLQRTKVNAQPASRRTHARKCNAMSAAQPILPSRNSLLSQVNISRTSVKDQRKRGTSASGQRIIREPSEEHQNIRRTSEEHQRIRSLAHEHQQRIGKLSVAHSAASRQLRLSIRSGLCHQQIGGRTPTIPAAHPPRTRGSRACVMAVDLRRYRSYAAHRGFVGGQLAEAPNLFWLCAGKMSAQSGAIQPAFPVQSNRQIQSTPVTCSGRAALGGSNGAPTQQGYEGNGVAAGLHSKADLWRNPHRKPGRDPACVKTPIH